MTLLLELELGTEAVDRAKVDLVVAGFFADELPPRGPAGRVDWRLCGLISRQLAAERLRGDPGDAVLLATFDRLAAPHVLALGLGARAHFGLDDTRSHIQDAVSRAGRLGAESIALAPGNLLGVQDASGPGSAARELSELAVEVVNSALEQLRIANAAAEDQRNGQQPGGTPSTPSGPQTRQPPLFRIRLLMEADEALHVRLALAHWAAGQPEVIFDAQRTRPDEQPVPSGIGTATVPPIGP